MLLATYSDLRHHFTLGGYTAGVSLTYDHVANTISRSSGSFVTDGFVDGMTLDVFGTASNDARYSITSVSALVIAIAEQLDADETTATSALWGAFYEADGMAQWPRAKMHTAGFDAQPTVSARPFSPMPITLSCNGGVTDATAGTTYKWYLSQRTDVVANQRLLLTHPDAASTGTVQLELTALAVSSLDLGATTDPLNVGQRTLLLKHCHLYVQRASDRAIQFYDLGRISEGHTV